LETFEERKDFETLEENNPSLSLLTIDFLPSLSEKIGDGKHIWPTAYEHMNKSEKENNA